MGATVSQWNDYNLLAAQLHDNPESVNYTKLSAQIAAMQEAGTPFKRVVVQLRPDWPQGQRVRAAYDGARDAQQLPLPPLEWQGGKSSVYNPDRESVQEELNKLHEQSRLGGTGNPFADKLAALKRA